MPPHSSKTRLVSRLLGLLVLTAGCAAPPLTPPPPPKASAALPPICFAGDAKLKAIRHRVPVYPAAASDQKVSGEVTYRFTVEPDGYVANATILMETPPGFGFGQAVLDALAQSRFCPKFENGTPVAEEHREMARLTSW